MQQAPAFATGREIDPYPSAPVDEVDGLTDVDLAIRRYKLRHELMNEIFGPHRICASPRSSCGSKSPIDLLWYPAADREGDKPKISSVAQLPPPPIIPKAHYSLAELESKLVRSPLGTCACSLTILPRLYSSCHLFFVSSCTDRAARLERSTQRETGPRSGSFLQGESGEHVCRGRMRWWSGFGR